VTTISVEHLGGDRFEISMRDHRVVVDQPESDGGEDTGPTPTELFVAGLVSCVAHYARRYLARHGLPTAGLSVTGEFEIVSRPARVGAIDIRIALPVGVPADRRAALLAVASHCTVHNTLDDVPPVTIELGGDPIETRATA
jgi:putative redox protein